MKSILACLGTALCLLFSFTIAPANAHDLVSADDDEVQGPENSGSPSVSGDGRYVVFDTTSPLLPEDDNDKSDVYWKDLTTRELHLLSKNAEGEVGTGASSDAVISADGNWVVFQSSSNNLVGDDDENTGMDIFVCDISSGDLTIVSLTPSGEAASHSSQRPSISSDGSVVAFESLSTNLSEFDNSPDLDVYVVEVGDPNSIQLVSRNESDVPGNNTDQHPCVSGNGKYVAFTSFSDNLHEDDTDTDLDVFLYEIDSKTLELVSYNKTNSQASNGRSQYPSLDHTGRLVTFYSTGTDLTAEDSDSTNDVFFRNMNATTPENILVSKNSAGDKANSTSASRSHALSADGRYVTFRSRGTNMGSSNVNAGMSVYHIFIRDLDAEETYWINDVVDGADADSDNPAISADGKTVVYSSEATNLVNFDENGVVQDIFASPGTDFTFDREARDAARAAAIQKAALRAQLTKKLRKFKDKLRKFRRAKKTARVKAFKKKIKKVKKQLRSL